MDLPRDVLNLVDGALVPAADGAWLENVEPATGGPLGRIARSGAADVERAVAAAQRAAPAWAAATREARSGALSRLADLVEANLEALARAESIDNGKPIALARRLDIPRAVANLRFFATAILHGRDEAYVTDDAAINYVERRPLGVVGCISPWNLPLYLFTWKIAPALAAGNAVVAKPSEVTPVTAAMLAALALEAGLPPGVLNVLHGLGPEVGQAIVEHPRIKAISFTGGTATGAAIARTAAPMFKKLSLELGGKNATVVFADALDGDGLAATAAVVARAAFANQGQVCLCGSRILVERSALERFTTALVERVRAIRVGDPLDETVEHGSLVSSAHRAKVESCIDLARAEGGTILCGGGRPRDLPERCRSGFFVEPTLVTGLGPACRTNQEEIFGPVAALLPFDREDEAIAVANGTRYGLSASVWTRDLDRAHRVAHRLEAGTVWINCWLLRDLRVPFGGVKDSGVGREGGDEALRFFTEPTTVCVARR